jgi:uncharacterized protein (UPF0333 family)
MFTRRGQSIMEYALILLVVVAAIFASSFTFKIFGSTVPGNRDNVFKKYFDKASGVVSTITGQVGSR